MLGKGDYAYAEVFYGERRPIMIDMVADWNAETAARYSGVRKKGEVLISESSEFHRPFGDQHFKNTAGPLYDENGRMIGAIETIHDITERRETEKALAEREALLRLFVENTPVAVVMCDTHMNYLAYSRRWITDYNLPDVDLRGRCHYDVFEVIPAHWKEEHRRCFAGETIENDEELFTRADGTTDWVRRTLHPWRTKTGEIGGLILFTEVTTPKKQAEENLGMMERVLENSPAVLFRWSAAAAGWPVTYVSGNIRQFGYSADEFMSTGKPYASIIHPDDVESVKQLAASPLRRDDAPF
jgi:PAS domain S-box-containing protein